MSAQYQMRYKQQNIDKIYENKFQSKQNAYVFSQLVQIFTETELLNFVFKVTSLSLFFSPGIIYNKIDI